MAGSFEHGYALLIGVDENQESAWALPAVTRDIAALQQVLTHPRRCGYRDDNIRVLTRARATRGEILAGFGWLKDCIEADKSGEVTAIIYYSGHGWRDTFSNPPSYYLIPHDANRNLLRASALRASDVAEAIAGLSPRRLLVMLDCCHAGGMEIKDLGIDGYVPSAVPPAAILSQGSDATAAVDALADAPADTKGMEALQTGHGRAVLSSSQGQEKSYIRPDGSMSYFTYHLIKALTGHAKPVTGATEVLVSDVVSYVHRHVPDSVRKHKNCSQRPEFRITGNFPIALLLGGEGIDEKQGPPEPLEPLPAVQLPSSAGQRNVTIGNGATGLNIVTGNGNTITTNTGG